MKRFILLLWLCILFVNLQAQSTFDVRNVRWGMTKAEVKTAESGKKIIPELTTEKSVVYSADVLSFPSILAYSFETDMLSSLIVIFEIENLSNNKFPEDYNKIKSALDSKYGYSEPQITWRDDLFKDDINNIGIALKLQHVEYMTRWENERTIIVLNMASTNGEIGIRLLYISKTIKSTYKDDKEDI